MKKDTILIVEDNSSLRKIVKSYLEKSGYKTEEAADGVEAIKCLQRNRAIGVVLLDMMMPVMDGKAFLEKIEKYKNALGIRICMLTALEPLQHLKLLIKRGMDDYLVKPVDRDLLLDKVASFMKEKSEDCFYHQKMKLPGLLMLPGENNVSQAVEIEMSEISEATINFVSKEQFKIGDQVLVNATFLMPHCRDELGVRVRIFALKKMGGAKTEYSCCFVAQDEAFTKAMRSFTLMNRAEQEQERLREEQIKKDEEKVAS